MEINAGNLQTLYTGFQASFRDAYDSAMATAQWRRCAREVPSNTKTEEYGWLGAFPSLQEWVGDRVYSAMQTHDYAIKNRRWQMAVEIDRDSIEDDTYGVFTPMFDEMGRAAAAHPDELVFEVLKNGFGSAHGLCYDGQYMFDTDHPVVGKDGVTRSVSNTGGGAGTPWFLIDDSRQIKPVIFQNRRPPGRIVRKDRDEDDNTFDRNQFVYGVDCRDNAGFGLWQLAFGSKQTLNAAAYEDARAKMQAFTADGGRPLGVRPNLLVVPPSLEGKALEIIKAERNAQGATNVWMGTAEVMVVPWLV